LYNITLVNENFHLYFNLAESFFQKKYKSAIIKVNTPPGNSNGPFIFMIVEYISAHSISGYSQQKLLAFTHLTGYITV